MANIYYQHTTYPIYGSQSNSAQERAEFDKIVAAFDKLPAPTGYPYAITVVNASGTALTLSAATLTAAGVMSGLTGLSGSGSLTWSSGAINLTGGTVTVATQSQGDNSTKASSTAYVDAAVAAEVAARGTAVSNEATARQNADAALALSITSSGSAPAWVSGTTYSLGQIVYSPISFMSYRRIVAGAGTTDPSLDGTNWTPISGNVTTSSANNFTKPQRPSLSSETAPSANTVTWDLTSDQVFRINLNANITTFNLTGTLLNLIGNQYECAIRYNGGSAITWPATVKWTAGTAPALTGTSGKIDVLTFTVLSNDGGTTAYLVNTGIKLNL